MKIVFCSTYSGQAGTSSNLAAVAAFVALHSNETGYLMQAQYQKNHLDEIFIHKDWQETGQQVNGIDSLARIIKSEPITKEMMDSCSISLCQGKLFLLPATLWNNSDLYETAIDPMLIYCMNAINQEYDITYMDLGKVKDFTSNQLLFHADVIVVNLCQNHSVLEEYFTMKHEWKQKVFYLIGNYDPISKYNLQYIHRRYHVPMEMMGVLPYNSMFKDACSDGAVVKFLSQIEHSTREEMNYYFIRELADTVEKLSRHKKKVEELEGKIRRRLGGGVMTRRRNS